MTVARNSWRRRLAMALVAALAALSLLGLHAAAGESATVSRAGGATEKIANFMFQPTPLRVSAGTRVVFSNRSQVSHTATANGGGFDTGVIRPGHAAAVTFARAGTYVFHCEIHPFMHGRIIVGG